MEVIVDEPNKLVEVWITNSDSEKQATKLFLETLYKENKIQKYKTVVFRSGKGNLEDFTSALISKNYRKIMAGKM